MGTRKMAFSVGFVSEALATRPAERDEDLVRACEIANDDPGLAEIEKDLVPTCGSLRTDSLTVAARKTLSLRIGNSYAYFCN